jgi:hypothetical protein
MVHRVLLPGNDSKAVPPSTMMQSWPVGALNMAGWCYPRPGSSGYQSLNGKLLGHSFVTHLKKALSSEIGATIERVRGLAR